MVRFDQNQCFSLALVKSSLNNYVVLTEVWWACQPTARLVRSIHLPVLGFDQIWAESVPIKMERSFRDEIGQDKHHEYTGKGGVLETPLAPMALCLLVM